MSKEFDDMDHMPDWDRMSNFFKGDDGDEWKNQAKIERAKKLYNQAKVLYKYAALFCETLKGDTAEMTKELIMQNALMLGPKIIGAEGGDSYVIRMENASIIRTNARELETQVKASFLYGVCTEADKDVVVVEIERFRQLFIEWVKYFETTEDDWADEWGLY